MDEDAIETCRLSQLSLWDCRDGDTLKWNWRLVQTLVEAGADVNEIYRGTTMLHRAVVDRAVGAIEVLLRHGADSTHTVTTNGRCLCSTPLMVAASRGFDECVAALVRGGADVNYCTPEEKGEFDALHAAVLFGNGSLHAVKTLLALGADPNLCEHRALFSAIRFSGSVDSAEIVAVLLKAGANVNAVTQCWLTLSGDQQFTPLDAAQRVVCSEGAPTLGKIERTRRDIVPTLLRAGATIQPRNAADPAPAVLEAIKAEYGVWLHLKYALELSTYLRKVLAAGGFAKYDRSSRAPFVAMLQRSLPVPGDAISVICEFWLRVGEYYPGAPVGGDGVMGY